MDVKRVLVTGGTSGPGLAMADALARPGAAVALTGRPRRHTVLIAAARRARRSGISDAIRTFPTFVS